MSKPDKKKKIEKLPIDIANYARGLANMIVAEKVDEIIDYINKEYTK